MKLFKLQWFLVGAVLGTGFGVFTNIKLNSESESKFYIYNKVKITKGFYTECIGEVDNYIEGKYIVWTSCWNGTRYQSQSQIFLANEMCLIPNGVYRYLKESE